jgi:hypothetical protein
MRLLGREHIGQRTTAARLLDDTSLNYRRRW